MPVGWTYFTTRELCGDTITNQTIKGGTSIPGTEIADTTFMTTVYCSGNRQGQVRGNHEVKGDYTATKDWTKSEYITSNP